MKIQKLMQSTQYMSLVIDENTKTDAINSIHESEIDIQGAAKLQRVPVKSEVGTVPGVQPQLPTLPSALIEQAVTNFDNAHGDEIPTKLLKVKSVSEDIFLDDWFSDMMLSNRLLWTHFCMTGSHT